MVLAFFLKMGFDCYTETLLFSVVTTFALSEDRLLGFLVLGHLELFVLVGVRTVGPAGLGDVDHFETIQKRKGSASAECEILVICC